MYKILKNITFIAATSFSLTACNIVTGANISPSTKLEDVAKSGEGIVVFYAGFGNKSCESTSLRLGKWNEEHKGYEQDGSVVLSSLFTNKDIPMQHKFKAGEYNIVRLVCKFDGGTLDVFAPFVNTGNGLFGGRFYSRPIASFSVKAGEVVNIGAMNIISGLGSASSTIEPLSLQKLEKFAELYPALSAKMVSRQMQK